MRWKPFAVEISVSMSDVRTDMALPKLSKTLWGLAVMFTVAAHILPRLRSTPIGGSVASTRKSTLTGFKNTL